MFLEHIGLHPPGAIDALGSGGREKENEAWMRRIRVEPRLEGLDRVKIVENGRLTAAFGTGAIACEHGRREHGEGERKEAHGSGWP